jgi:hypothetical protein
MAMSRGLVASGLGFFGSGAILRLLAASQVRGNGENLGRVAEEPVTVDGRDVEPSPPTSFIVADRDRSADNLDAVAGSEFVDDRIRLRE